MSRKPVVRWIFVFLTFAVVSASAEWTVIERCHLVENQFNDADSFVVECSEAYRGKTQNRFRLYFVDAAETDRKSDFKQERLVEQAKYWGSDDPDFALKIGIRAERFVKRLMRGGFSVYTQGESAPTLGAPRYYAMIRVKDRWLDEILVEEGLVRIYGKGTDLPNDTAEKMHWSQLHRMERTAKPEGRNGWQGHISDEVKPQTKFVAYDTLTSRDAWIYSVKDGRKVTVIGTGTQVAVTALADGSRLRIRFKKNGKVYEGLCEKKSLK